MNRLRRVFDDRVDQAIWLLIMGLALILLGGCGLFGGDSAPEEQNKVKAPVQAPAGTAAAKKEAQKNQGPGQKAAEGKATAQAEKAIEAAPEKPKAPVIDMAELVDPFQPIPEAMPKQPVLAAATPTVKKGPLQDVELSELQLVAIVASSGKNLALVQNKAGVGFIIKVGDPVGKKDGVVAEITPETVVVNEKGEIGRGKSKKEVVVPYIYNFKREKKDNLAIKITGGESK